MTPERWKRIEAIYHDALQRPPAERRAFLDAACANDSSIRREIESLLAESSDLAQFMERAAMDVQAEAIAMHDASIQPLKPAGAAGGNHVQAPQLGSRYEVLEEVGRGGMGVVFRARDRETDDIIALKVLRTDIAADRQMVDRFKTELKLSRRVTHRNVCRIYDISRAGNQAYISMEYVRGESLRRVLNRLGSLNVRKATDIVRQICAGLREAHRQGIIHRDLKPENIMLDESGNVKIMDFGIARLASSWNKLTDGLVGTPAYMSPEQAEGRDVDARSDIYSLGLVMYEIFTGQAAFSGDTPIAVALKQIREAPPDPRTLEPLLPETVERAILKCLEKDPTRRFQSLAELEAGLGDTQSPVRGSVPQENSSRISSWFGDTAYVIRPTKARALLIVIQLGYLALYTTALFYLDASIRVLEQQLGIPYVRALQLLIPAAVGGIAVRMYLLSAIALNHPATGKQFWRLFPILLLLDEVWAASPLLLAPRIGVGTALACIAALAYLPFSQKTLIHNAYR